jgi:hypothetical protein
MSARQEKVREALMRPAVDRADYERLAAALAEVEEWETRCARGDELLSQAGRALEAAEADLNETRSLLLKATDDRRLRAAEAEADRLRAAVEEITDWDCPEGWGGAGFAHVRQIARAALAPADKKRSGRKR